MMFRSSLKGSWGEELWASQVTEELDRRELQEIRLKHQRIVNFENVEKKIVI